jgi:hypothetical protein
MCSGGAGGGGGGGGGGGEGGAGARSGALDRACTPAGAGEPLRAAVACSGLEVHGDAGALAGANFTFAAGALPCAADTARRVAPARVANRTLLYTSTVSTVKNTAMQPTITRATAYVRIRCGPVPTSVTPLWNAMPARRINRDATSISVSNALYLNVCRPMWLGPLGHVRVQEHEEGQAKKEGRHHNHAPPSKHLHRRAKASQLVHMYARIQAERQGSQQDASLGRRQGSGPGTAGTSLEGNTR